MRRHLGAYAVAHLGIVGVAGVQDARGAALQLLRGVAQHHAGLVARHLQHAVARDDDAHGGAVQHGLELADHHVLARLLQAALLHQALEHAHQLTHLAARAGPVHRLCGLLARAGPEQLARLEGQLRQWLRHPAHQRHGQQHAQHHAGHRQPPGFALGAAQRCQQRLRLAHARHDPLRQRHARHAHDVVGLHMGHAPPDHGLGLALPAGVHGGQARLVTHLAQHAGGVGVRQDGAVAGEDDELRVVARGQRHRRWQQALGLQPQSPGHHPHYGAVVAVQRHGEHDACLATTASDQLGHQGFAIDQRAAQCVALGRVQVRCLFDLAGTQIEAQFAVVARDLHGVEKLHRRQALLQQPFQRRGRLQHGRRDASSHRAQHLLALFDLAGQQTGHHLDLVGLLAHHPAHGLLSGGPCDQPGGHRPRQRHRQRGHQHQPQHQGAGHQPARRRVRGSLGAGRRRHGRFPPAG